MSAARKTKPPPTPEQTALARRWRDATRAEAARREGSTALLSNPKPSPTRDRPASFAPAIAAVEFSAARHRHKGRL
jgi:hypothetical protein